MNMEKEHISRNFFKTALVFESAMIPIAIGLGVLCGLWSWSDCFAQILNETPLLSALIYGLFALIPMLLLLVFSATSKMSGVVRLREIIHKLLVPTLREMSMWQLAVVGLLAGAGEEWLFRGYLQTWLTTLLPGTPLELVPILIVSVVFGALHAITFMYAALVFIVSIYLGVVYESADQLLTPMIAHGVYDVIALVFIVNWDHAETELNTPECLADDLATAVEQDSPS